MFTGTAFNTVTARTFYKRGDAVDDAYYRGSRVKLRGTKYEGKLYDADGVLLNGTNGDDFYLDDGDYVYRIGSSCGTLYKSGGSETVSVGTDEYTGALYTAGKAYSNGLYTNFELAKLTTRNVMMLTV